MDNENDDLLKILDEEKKVLDEEKKYLLKKLESLLTPDEEEEQFPTRDELMAKYHRVDELLDRWSDGDEEAGDKVFVLLEEIRNDVALIN